MSRKSQNSRRSSPKEPSIEPKQKFEIFANLPFAVFREYTNVRSLIVDRYRLLQDGKNPTNFHIQIHTRDYYDKLSHVDKWDGLFKDLEFIGSESSENNAKIWLLSKREQKRVLIHSTDHQKRFLYLPKNVLLRATNFEQLVCAAAAEHGATHLANFVDDIFNSLPKYDNWIPALSNLKFLENSNDNSNDASGVENKPETRSTARRPSETRTSTPRGLRKRKSRFIVLDDEASEDTNPTSAKRTRCENDPNKPKKSVHDENDDHNVTILEPHKETKIPLSRLVVYDGKTSEDANQTSTKRMLCESDRNKSKENVHHENDDHRVTIVRPHIESKIPLPDNKRKSKASNTTAEIVFIGPNESQLKIKDLNFEDFVNKTNIKQIILNEYRNDKQDINANIPDVEYTNRLIAYNEKRRFTRDWRRSGLKKLKLIDDEPKQNSDAPQQRIEDTTTPLVTVHDETCNRSELHTNRSAKLIQPNDFQKEIMAMDFEKFINQTNVKELVRKRYETDAEPLTEAIMDTELKRLYDERYNVKRFYTGLLNHLKILQCECQRNKTFKDKWTQTDVVRTQDDHAQCDAVDFNSSDVSESEENILLHDSNQLKLDMLSVHEIMDSEIIQMECISSSFDIHNENVNDVADIITTTESHNTIGYPLKDLLLAEANETEFDSSGSHHEISKNIEDVLASFEMENIVQDRNVDQQQLLEEVVSNDPTQLGSSTNEMTIAYNIDLQDESKEIVDADETIAQSELDDNVLKTKIISENVSGDAQQNLTLLALTEADYMDRETSIESKNDENQLDSTQPPSISGEKELVANVTTTPCQQIKPNTDTEESMVSNEESDIQEQSSVTSSEAVNSLRLSTFEPNEKSTPKSMNEFIGEGKPHKIPFETVKHGKKRTSSESGLKSAQNPPKEVVTLAKFLKDPAGFNAWLSSRLAQR